MIKLIIEYYIYYLLAFFLVFIIGKYILKIIKKGLLFNNFFEYVFVCSFIGLISITCLGAVIITGLKTILSGIIFLSFILIYKTKKEPCHNLIENNLKFSIKEITFLILPGILFFSVFAFYSLKNDGNYIVVESQDYAYHSILSKTLISSGLENLHLGKVIEPREYSFCQPYHYFDLWFNGIISYFFQNINYLNLFLVTYPLILTISFIGYLAFWNYISKVNLIVIIFIFLLYNIGKIYFDIYNKYYFLSSMPYKFHWLSGNWLHSPKHIQLLPFIIGSILYFKNNKLILGFCLLFCVFFIYATTVPVLSIAVCIFLIINYFIKKIPVKNVKFILLLLVTSCSYFFLFYKITGYENTYIKPDLYTINNIVNTFKTHVLYTPIQLIAVSLPILFFLLILYPGKKFLEECNYKFIYFIITLSFCIVLGGFTAWTFLMFYTDSIQLLGNNLFIVLYLLNAIFIVYITTLFHNKLIRVTIVYKIALALFIVFLMYRYYEGFNKVYANKLSKDKCYSDEYINAISTYVKNSSINPIGVSIKNKARIVIEANIYHVFDAHKENANLDLVIIKNLIGTINISVYDIPFPSDLLGKRTQQEAINQNIFYKFVNKQKAKNNFINIEQSQLEFIKFHKIDYLIAYQNTEIPESIERLKKHEIIDSFSNEKIIFF